VEIIVDAETKNQARWNIDTEKRGGNESIDPMGKYEGEPETHAQADRESQENRYATQPGKSRFMDMAAVPREGNPSSPRGHVAHLARRHKRHSQRERKYTKEQKRQPQLPFRLKHPAFQAKLAERIFRLFFQTKFSYRAQEIRNFWLQELYIRRLALGKVLAAAGQEL
jgi:hypothetical protein